MKKAIIILISLLSVIYTGAQNADDYYDTSGRELNAILTTVPFLTIAPDARGGAMGDAGVATSPDASSQYWNPAKYAFMTQKFGVNLAYTPWLQRLNIDDLNIVYLSGFYKFDQKQALSLGLRYFNLGTIQFTNPLGQNIGVGNPNEFAVDLAYSRLFSEHFSGGLVFRYIRSDIAGGQISGTVPIEIEIGQSWAADIALYYQKPLQINDYDAEMAYGLNISNIGAKMSYSAGATKEFIPTNMRLGGRFSINLDEYNALAATIDFNKLLVPTPPEMDDDSLIAGMSDDVGTITGIFQSFYDAPGYPNADGTRTSAFVEELNEIMISGGLEYWYRQQFAVRAGYFYEHQSKGNRKYITTGIGLKLNVFTLDFSYLIATGRNSPLDRTMRFTLGFIF